MEKRFDQMGIYEYQCVDGTVLRLRRMSDRERESFLLGKGQAMFRQASKLAEELDEMGAPADWEFYLKYIKTLRKLIKGIAISKEAVAVLEKLDERDRWYDAILLTIRIFSAEFALSQGQDVPEQTTVQMPDEIDELPDKEVERLGESSPPNSQAGDTSPASAPAGTSSSGAKRTKARKRKTSATSPSQS